jgi:hypothetical protein
MFLHFPRTWIAREFNCTTNLYTGPELTERTPRSASPSTTKYFGRSPHGALLPIANSAGLEPLGFNLNPAATKRPSTSATDLPTLLWTDLHSMGDGHGLATSSGELRRDTGNRPQCFQPVRIRAQSPSRGLTSTIIAKRFRPSATRTNGYRWNVVAIGPNNLGL